MGEDTLRVAIRTARLCDERRCVEQSFAGEGLSGTGPKAGGPFYLHRFATERTRSVNISALGGNSGLLTLSED